MDSTNGILEGYMGNHESLRKTMCANKAGSALYFAILQHRKNLQEESTDEKERFEEFLTIDEELNPKTKPKKEKGEKGEKSEKTDNDEDEDELAYHYTYIGKAKSKGEDGSVVEYEAELKKKKFVTMPIQAKLILQCIINCTVHECHSYYMSNNKSLPAADDSILSEIIKYTQTQCDGAVSPFVFEVADLYGNISDMVEDEPKKGTGALRKYLETEFKKVFETGKSKRTITSQLFKIQNTIINFLKTLAVFIMDYMWETKAALNSGKLLGSIRQLSRLVASKGAECPQSFYECADIFVSMNATKSAKEADADGDADGDGKEPTAPKKPTKGKGKGRGKAAGAKASKAKASETKDDDAASESKTVDAALDNVDGGEEFGSDWTGDALE
jgi:hypothetical protein